MRCAFEFFVISGHFDAMHGKKVNARTNYKQLLIYHA